jgi:hypothetical protein
METSKQRRQPADTQEFLAMWDTAKEQHFVQELVPLLPRLLGSPVGLGGKPTEEAARHLVRAMHLTAMPEGGLHTGIDYLRQVAEGNGSADLE